MKNISGNWWFLIGVVICYLIVLFFDYSLVIQAFIQTYSILKDITLIIIGVFVLIYLSHRFFKPKQVAKILGQSSGLKGWVIAILAGLISMGPIYAWYPLLKNLQLKGMRISLLVAFLNNRAVKIPLLPMMIFYFGWPFTIIVNGYLIIFSIINGLIIEKYFNDQPILKDNNQKLGSLD